ncbi:hypothetical protein SAMN05421630_1191, partial [Prauserella marina]
MTLDIQTQNLLSPLASLHRRTSQLHTPSLTPTPSLHLRLHHHRATKTLSNNTRFIRTNRHSTRQNRHTMGSEEILRLIL